MSPRRTAFKVQNLRQDPHVWLCVLPDEFFGRWIQIGGTVRIVELPEPMEALVDYYRRVSGEHSDWDEYRRVMERERRVLLRSSSVPPDLTGPGDVRG